MLKTAGWLVVVIMGAVLIIPGRAPASVTAVETSGGRPIGSYIYIDNENYNLYHSSVAYDVTHENYLAIWHDEDAAYSNIWGCTISPNGWNGGLLGIAPQTNDSAKNADLAYSPDRDNFLVVFELFETYNRVYGLTYHPGQTPGIQFTLGTGFALRNRFLPAVAYSTTSDKYLVVWESIVVGALSGDIEGIVVTGEGAREGDSFLIAQGDSNYDHTEPDVAYLAALNQYLVVWTREDKNTGDKDIVGRRLTPTGGFVDAAPFNISQETVYDDHAPAIAGVSIGPGIGSYEVVWEMDFSGIDHDIYGRAVQADGSMESKKGINTNFEYQKQPAVAGNQDTLQFLAVWAKEEAGMANTGIYGQALSMDGEWIGGGENIGALFGGNPSVADGEYPNFLVAYDDWALFGNQDIWGRFWAYSLFLPGAWR